MLSTNPPWLVNPDIPIPWSEVRAVISFDRSSSGFQESLPCRIGSLDDYSPCPICLDSPILPVMTHCGHIYCTCCILRYMNQEFHRKCPICSVAISRSDLKEIIAPSFPLRHTLAPLRPQSSATFSLVIKLTGSLSPFRASILTDTTNPTHILCCPPSCSSLDIIYSRACLASHEELLSLRENRIQEILRYREACLASVKEKLDHEREIRSTSLAQKSKIRSRGWEQIDSLQLSEPIISVSTSSVDPITTHGDVENLPFLSEAEDLIRKEIIAESSQTSTMSQIGFSDMLRREDLVYSYQLAPDISDMEDIQIDPPTFLHPFCVRCLVSDLNNSEAIDSLSGLLSLPHIIAGKVLEVSTETVTEVGRKRYPFLRHLPLDSLYQLIEIDMVDCLSTKTYERFWSYSYTRTYLYGRYRGEFHNRNLKRQERILEEERTEKFYRERQ